MKKAEDSENSFPIFEFLRLFLGIRQVITNFSTGLTIIKLVEKELVQDESIFLISIILSKVQKNFKSYYFLSKDSAIILCFL